MGCFESVNVFEAVTPEDYIFNGDAIKYNDICLPAGKMPNNNYGNFLSNYMLWKRCIELNTPILILEDDALLPCANSKTIHDAIKTFEQLSNINCPLLYLCSQSPHTERLKSYDEQCLRPLNNHLYLWHSYEEKFNPDSSVSLNLACTAAYVIRPDTAKSLIEFAQLHGAVATDRFVLNASFSNVINVLIPKSYHNQFLLYEQTSTWNNIHNPHSIPKHKMTPPRWEELTQQLQLEYLLGGKIKKEDWYIDETNPVKKTWTPEDFNNLRKRVRDREVNYYGETDKWLYETLELCPIGGINVAVMGSTEPWYETIVLEFGGKPTTIEYNLPEYKNSEMEEISIQEYWKTPRQFDIAISISSFEHDGLGRYGDPLNPSGDLRAMAEMKRILKKDGILILAVPVGVDKLVWNAHRIYGPVRFPMLTAGWKLEGCVGMDESLMSRDTGVAGTYQPVIVLRNTELC
jgi:GR25 family glycosyltransferase involved in LPS biosynthesis